MLFFVFLFRWLKFLFVQLFVQFFSLSLTITAFLWSIRATNVTLYRLQTWVPRTIRRRIPAPAREDQDQQAQRERRDQQEQQQPDLPDIVPDNVANAAAAVDNNNNADSKKN